MEVTLIENKDNDYISWAKKERKKTFKNCSHVNFVLKLLNNSAMICFVLYTFTTSTISYTYNSVWNRRVHFCFCDFQHNQQLQNRDRNGDEEKAKTKQKV